MEDELSKRKKPEGVEFLDDLSPARWLQETLWPCEMPKGKGVSVGGLVPEGYSSYARIFHPVIDVNARQPEKFTWSTIAERNGRTTHPQMRYWRIAGMPEPYPHPSWRVKPDDSSLPIDETRAVVELLRQHTSTPDRCYFCVWEGWGVMDLSLFGDARLRFKHRDYLVFTGPIEAALSFAEIGFTWFQSPAIWWPDDRAWCVATEIDMESTYVGGTDECVQALLEHSDLEVLPANIDARVGPAGDPGDLFK